MNGREYVRAVAEEVRDWGWEAPEDFNVVWYTRATAAELLLLLERAGAQTKLGTRGERRLARKLAHYLHHALRDIGADLDEVDAAAEREPGIGEEPDVELLCIASMECAERRRAEMALGAEHLPTATRGPKVVLALTRLIENLERGGVAPVGRARDRDAAPAPPPRPDRDVRADSEPEPGSEESVSEGVEEEPVWDVEDAEAGGSLGETESASSRERVVTSSDDESIRDSRTRGTVPSPRTTRSRRGAGDREPEGASRAGDARPTGGLIGGLPDDGWEPIN